MTKPKDNNVKELNVLRRTGACDSKTLASYHPSDTLPVTDV